MSFLGCQADFSVSVSMESPRYMEFPSSAPEDRLTPGQMPLVIRNAAMLEALTQAVAEVEREGRLVASQTKWMARRFLQLLPSSVPVTDVYVSDEQSICFDWDEDTQCQLSIMVQEGGRIAFAAYFGGDRLNGASGFTGADLPGELSAAISRWQRGGTRR